MALPFAALEKLHWVHHDCMKHRFCIRCWCEPYSTCQVIDWLIGWLGFSWTSLSVWLGLYHKILAFVLLLYYTVSFYWTFVGDHLYCETIRLKDHLSHWRRWSLLKGLIVMIVRNVCMWWEIDWVKFIIPPAPFRLYEMPMLRTWDRLLVISPKGQEGGSMWYESCMWCARVQISDIESG